MSANKQEPSKSWGSTKTNIPSTSLNDCRLSKSSSGLGHNLISVGQFLDSNHEVAFLQHTLLHSQSKDSGLVPNLLASTPLYHHRDLLEMLIQPMFDESLTSLITMHQKSLFLFLKQFDNLTCGISGTTFPQLQLNQDAKPSPVPLIQHKHSNSNYFLMMLNEDDHDIEVAHMREEVYVASQTDFDPDKPNHLYKHKESSLWAETSLKNSDEALDTPMVEKSKLDEDKEGNAVDPSHYRAFADADHAGCQDTRRSTSGSIQLLGDRLVSWSSKRQKSAAISSTEAEYIALSGCCAQILWMRSQLTDYGFGFNKIPISSIMASPVTLYQEHDENGVIELYFVNTEYQLADIFTKALGRERIEFLINKLGMRNAPEIYMQEFWASAYVHNRSVRFKMNNKKHIIGLEQFRGMDILKICPKSIIKLTDVNVNKLHQPWRSFAAVINKCLSGTPSYDSLRLSQAQILWGMYNKKNVGFMLSSVEDIQFSRVRTKVQEWQCDVLSSGHTKFSRQLLALNQRGHPHLGNPTKEYYARALGTIPPKTKGSKKKANTDAIPKQKPPTAPKEKKSGKGKQKSAELETISEADLTEAEQLKIVTKRSPTRSSQSLIANDDILEKSSDDDQDDDEQLKKMKECR
ncbi:hypothetical protein Tco_0656851 [Tanacetum coccineum]|uniref:Retrovirus-related Pol polyprotein from transposon TNT 1-94 n=1 Tax=Tanacetum coccineum TaxID=301880 RepID=A0ABQ4XB61_9ASTR